MLLRGPALRFSKSLPQSRDLIVHYNCDKAKRSEAATLGGQDLGKERFGRVGADEAAGR